jgi:hypothetical protein
MATGVAIAQEQCEEVVLVGEMEFGSVVGDEKRWRGRSRDLVGLRCGDDLFGG